MMLVIMVFILGVILVATSIMDAILGHKRAKLQKDLNKQAAEHVEKITKSFKESANVMRAEGSSIRRHIKALLVELEKMEKEDVLIEDVPETLKEGDLVEVIKDFYFYDEEYKEGQRFYVDAAKVGCSFEKFVRKVEEYKKWI